MIILYWIGIKLYGIAVKFGIFFNEKARLFVDGRKGLFKRLESGTAGWEKCIWVHAASLGEFEQGRPIIERLKQQSPDYKILLSFFSPSGYEVRKDYEKVDFVTYLPLDGPLNARRFMEIIDPEIAIFIKYEFWYFFLHELHKRKIKTLLVSSIFRKSQLFFHWSGRFFHRVLRPVDQFFVQDEASGKLIGTITSNVTVSGDTRFDRVIEIAQSNREIETVKQFLNGEEAIVLGSVWEVDFAFIKPFIKKYQAKYKFIIAPHNLDQDEIDRFSDQIANTARYSMFENDETVRVLIIDNMGMLSTVYRYAKYAFVGGSFNGTLHNTLEAAVYGIPIFIGAHQTNEKFREALELRASGALFEFYEILDLEKKFLELENDQSKYMNAGRAAQHYVYLKRGATDKVVKYLEKIL